MPEPMPAKIERRLKALAAKSVHPKHFPGVQRALEDMLNCLDTIDLLSEVSHENVGTGKWDFPDKWVVINEIEEG